MDEILNQNVTEMAGVSFDCSCGRQHSVNIDRIVIGNDIIAEIGVIASIFKHGTVFVMADNNTYRLYAEELEKYLCSRGISIKTCILNGEGRLVPDEKALGTIMLDLEDDTSYIIAVGSGTINDLARFISHKLHIPYMVAATAPSMDGYASTVSPLIAGGFKKTFEAVYPYTIAAEMRIIQSAPMEMIQAGFGDIMGKFTALADWQLAREIKGEYYCKTCETLVRRALNKCVESACGVMKRGEGSVYNILEALLLSGIAMGLVGNSRPASGAEHHLAHYWEMDALSKGTHHPLHGNAVGVAAVVVSKLYGMMQERLPVGIDMPKAEKITELLGNTGACCSPAELGIKRELFERSLLEAMKIRPRYTIFHLAAEAGQLESCAHRLTLEFYRE